MQNLKSKYDLIIFDFDNTLCNINLFTLGIKINDINENNKTIKINNKIVLISTIFNNYDELIKIFKILKKQNIKLCIASLGFFDIISKIINISFPNYFSCILTSDNIDKYTGKKNFKFYRYLADPKCPKFYGKNVMIQALMDKFKIKDPSKILFFDDDYNNAICSVNAMKIHSYNNTINGINSKLLTSLIF